MAKRTYNRRGRQTAKTPVRNDGRGRVQRQKAAQVARDTGSKDRVTRGRGVTRTRTGAPRGAQGPRTAPQQGPNRPSPRNLTIGGNTGRAGGKENQPTRRISGPPTPGRGRVGRVGQQMRASQMAKNAVSAAARRIVGDGSAAAFQMAQMAAETLRQQRARKGTGKPMANMGKDYKAKERALGRKAIAQSFDRAFAAARKAGKKTFTFRGKKYNTKLKGE